MNPFIHQLKRHLPAAPFAGVLSAIVLVVMLIALDTSSLTYADDHAPEQTPVAGQVFQNNPFPITSEMTDTVQLVLDQYLGRQPFAPPVIDEQRLTPFSSPALTYLPAVQGSQSSRPPPNPPPPVERADIALTVWAEPSIYVMRSGRLTYELRLTNYDKGDAKHVRVTLPYDRRQMRLIASGLDAAKGDWVSRVTDQNVEVTFGAIEGQGQRTGRLMFEVASSLRNDTILDMRASYTWWDSADDYGPYRSNWMPVLVGNGPATAPWVWTQVTPQAGAAGTTHTFLSNRFTPGEGIITWLNTPSGVRALDLRGVADGQGVVSLTFSSSSLSPGTYQLVLYGARSKLTGVATFTVR